MNRLVTLIGALSFCIGTGLAQSARTNTEAIRFIKLGNTLRAVDKPQQAIELLQRALPAVQGKEPYWEAVAYENIGLAYSDQENTLDALRYFQQARELYRKLNYAASEVAMRQLVDEISGKNLYAGIDIGSSGVKLAIFRTSFENGFYTKDIRSKPLSPNVTLVAGTDKSFQAGLTVMRAYMDSIRHYNIPNERIYIAFSSGVNETLGKTPDRKKKLYDLLSSSLSNDSLKIDTTLTVAREAELFTVGAIPRKMWLTTSCIDIGSGNTKGGYFDANRVFHPVSFALGTKTLAALIEKGQSLPIETYKLEAERVMETITKTTINRQFNTNQTDATRSEWQQRKTVGLGGGIAWAMVTYLYPDRAGTTAVPLTLNDVEQFKRNVMLDYQALINPDLSNIADPVVRNKAEQDVLNAQTQFNEKQLIAGALLLETIFKAYVSPATPKRFVFIRDSDIGWVTGRFIESINRVYENKLTTNAR